MAEIALFAPADVRQRLRLLARGIEPDQPIVFGDLATLLPTLRQAADRDGRALVDLGGGNFLAIKLDQTGDPE